MFLPGPPVPREVAGSARGGPSLYGTWQVLLAALVVCRASCGKNSIQDVLPSETFNVRNLAAALITLDLIMRYDIITSFRGSFLRTNLRRDR
jgi:hypothetical protein